jgi:hypothetical protein
MTRDFLYRDAPVRAAEAPPRRFGHG